MKLYGRDGIIQVPGCRIILIQTIKFTVTRMAVRVSPFTELIHCQNHVIAMEICHVTNVVLDDISQEDKPVPPPFRYKKRVLALKHSEQCRIPLHGVLGGMWYDLNTRLYYGDGPPRRTPLRPDGSRPCAPGQAGETSIPNISVDTRKLTNDILHLQPMLEVRDNLLDFGATGVATMKFCRCINMWGPESLMKDHVCYETTIENRVQATPVSIKKARSACWAPDRGPFPRAKSDNMPQAEKDMCATKSAGIAIGAGDGNHVGVKIRDFAMFCVDGRGQKAFTGQIIRDFGARNQGKPVATFFCE